MIYRVYTYETDKNGFIIDCGRTAITIDATPEVSLKRLFLRLKSLGVLAPTAKLKCLRFRWQDNVIGVAHRDRPLFELRLNNTVPPEKHWFNWQT